MNRDMTDAHADELREERDRLKAERDEAVGLLRQLVSQESHIEIATPEVQGAAAFLARIDAREAKR